MAEQESVGEALLWLAMGGGLLVAFWLAWTGRWRSWSRDWMWHTLPLTVFPGVGAGLLVMGIYMLFPRVGSPLVGVGAALWCAGALLYWWTLWFSRTGHEPRWLQPRWLRDADRSLDMRIESNAALRAFDFGGPPLRSRLQVEEAFHGEARLARWGVNWVRDPDSMERDHGFAVVGGKGGRLGLFPSGLGFWAEWVEERVRLEPFGFVVRREQIRQVYTVPRRCRADGVFVRSQGLDARLIRSPYRRLVVDTDEGPLLFELWAADRKADEIASVLQVARGQDIRRPVGVTEPRQPPPRDAS